ncbi:MAG: PEP-CTERM sorting domain-containing protein [Verrucomicrobiales bacterium]|nr:PEP-CTERM sorting domain-containing protein [Verrucomicrobiales bacterium]
MKRNLILSLAAAVSFGATLSQAQLITFYVGQDGLATLASGTYKGLPNPNAGRLSFLYAHAYLGVTERVNQPPITLFNNHYHSIGIYTYTGPVEAPVTVPTNANFRIPEASTGQLPLTLVAETNGLFAGKLVNKKTVENYSDPRIRSVHDILPHITATATNQFGYGSAEYVMFYSSGGRWTNRLDGVVVAMELVEKSPELRVGTASQLEALVHPGDRVTMGNGNSFEFTPVVWAEPTTAPGTYELKFKLVDVSGGPSPLLESGIVTFWYRVVPEPELTVAKTVTVMMPAITDGYVLEEAPTVEGPWTAVTTAPTIETLTGGHSAAQTGNKFITQPGEPGSKFYRLRKL